MSYIFLDLVFINSDFLSLWGISLVYHTICQNSISLSWGILRKLAFRAPASAHQLPSVLWANSHLSPILTVCKCLLFSHGFPLCLYLVMCLSLPDLALCISGSLALWFLGSQVLFGFVSVCLPIYRFLCLCLCLLSHPTPTLRVMLG